MKVLGKIFYSVPVIGWLVKDAVHGTDEAKYFFFFNAFIALGVSVYTFGYPLAITLALIGTGLGLSWVILLSMGDVIERLLTRHAATVSHNEPADPIIDASLETIQQAA